MANQNFFKILKLNSVRTTRKEITLKELLDYAIKIAATWVACKKLHARIARPFTLRINDQTQSNF